MSPRKKQEIERDRGQEIDPEHTTAIVKPDFLRVADIRALVAVSRAKIQENIGDENCVNQIDQKGPERANFVDKSDLVRDQKAADDNKQQDEEIPA